MTTEPAATASPRVEVASPRPPEHRPPLAPAAEAARAAAREKRRAEVQARQEAARAKQRESRAKSGAAEDADTRTREERGLRDLLVFPKTRKLIVYWTPLVLLMTAIAIIEAPSWWTILGGIMTGVLLYSLIEYLMHRFLYHWEPESRFLRIITADMGRQHMGHHRNPGKYGGGINGNQLPIIIFASLVAIVVLLTPFPTSFGLMVVAAGAVNYVIQEFAHFGTHHLPMRSGYFAALKRHHMVHHFRDDSSNFGLFWTFWDILLGTDYETNARRRKATEKPASS
ncbi:sterol desaturase family protein [Acuticoccus kandeliae]|uniref:sterol desaturase family protein n=1 Tax=Acuticoccus kandeliae TaxID=2073160 RepID=UPI0013003C5C|nr:sterol desaturase family protein [Acuticoccus kandeliae]